jgi:acyl carrier protein
VKIRGIRVEPRKVEAVLLRHPYVSAAVVTAFRGRLGETRTIAYVQAKDEVRPEVAELRQFVARKLHKVMVPAAFVVLDRFPLSRSRKIDGSKLPAPEDVQPGTDTFVMPQTMDEEVLTLIWSQILGLERIGRHDNFLELGGNSLLAAELVYRVEQMFQVQLPLTAVYDYPTISELAKSIELAGGTEKRPKPKRQKKQS